jgi:hypothetical protein
MGRGRGGRNSGRSAYGGGADPNIRGVKPPAVDTSDQFQNQPGGNAGPNYDGPNWVYDYDTTDGEGPSGSSVVYEDEPEDQNLTPEDVYDINGNSGNSSSSSVGGGLNKRRVAPNARAQMNMTQGRGSSILTQ